MNKENRILLVSSKEDIRYKHRKRQESESLSCLFYILKLGYLLDVPF